MIRFAVLNEEEQPKSKDEESVEIQAEKCLGVYESAIRLLQKGQLDESRRMLKNLIESDLMHKIDSNSEMAAPGTPLRRLQYLVYTNYAHILERVSDDMSALQFYLKAIAFDNSDNSLWVRIGTLATKKKKFKLARYALESGLQQQQRSDVADESVLYEIGDFVACEDYIRKALRISPYFQRGLELLDLMRSRTLDVQEGLGGFDRKPLHTPAHTQNLNVGPKEIFLEEPSWLSLGEQLLEEYKSLLDRPEKGFYNQRLVVRTHKAQAEGDVEMAEDSVEEEEPDVPEADVSGEEIMQVDSKPAVEVVVEEPMEHTVPASITTEETGDLGEKESTEEQNAAMKRKRREVEERSGLRTSKRVRDKLEQFEETKRKREEEEQEMLAKYKIVLSKFGMDMENAYVYGSAIEALKPENIFPNGLSGLLVTFNKHLERPNALVQASSIEHIQQNEPATSPYFEDDTALFEFVERVNEQNSGIVEYLCEFVLTVLSGLTSIDAESNWQKRWPCGLRAVLSSAVCAIEDQLLEYLNLESKSDEASNELEQRISLELKLSICEMYLDEMVHAILHPFTVVSRKGRGVKKVDAEHVAKLNKQFQRWLYLAGLGLDSPLANSTKESIVSSTVPWLRKAVLRLSWMLGRHAQCLGSAIQAISCFEDCARLLKRDPSIIVYLPNCKYDTQIDAQRIQERLGRLKTHQYVLDAARLFEEEDYGAVMTRLEPIFLKKRESNRATMLTNEEKTESHITDTIGGSLSERLELMGLLYKSCEALESRTRQFHCISEMFVLVVETLVNTITDKSEATEVWFLFGQVSQTLWLLRETLQSSDLNGLLSSIETQLLQRLVCCVLAVARLGFVNMLHQDRLVDDDIKLSYSDLLKHRPHLEQFNLVLIRVWLVLLLLLPGWIQGARPNQNGRDAATEKGDHIMLDPLPLETMPLDLKTFDLDKEVVQRVLFQPLTTNSSTPLRMYTCPSQELYMELIALVHDDLGVRGICGIDNNQLIKLALKVSSPMQGPFYRKEENQCYYCFYGISLSVDGQYPIEHSSSIVDFDRTAATEFFPLLERSLSDKVLRGQVRGDLKDAVDRVEEALGSPPYESNSILEMNRQIINNYLASEINFWEAIQVDSRRSNLLPTMAQPPSSKLASVYRKIYAIQGKIFLAQFRNKAKNNQFKPLEDLQHAIDQFRTDIHVNPDCWESWYSLASCFAFLADENLVFSASDIKNNFSKITDLQKRAFHCFSQAVRLAPKRASRGLHSGASVEEVSCIEPQPRRQQEQQRERQGNEQVRDGQQENEISATWTEIGQESRLENERAISEGRESQQSGDLSDSKVAVDGDGHADDEWYQRQAIFWFDFGNLVHGIMSKPMRMEAMRRSGGIEVLSSDTGETMEVPTPEPSEEQVYKFAAFCFKRSLMLNDQNWRTPFMLAKCIGKLGGKPAQVLALYKLAVGRVPQRSGQPGSEKIFEAPYKIISALSKYLMEDKIKPAFVESLMTKTLVKSKLSVADGETFFFEPPEEHLQVLQSDPPTQEDLEKKEKLHAFRLLCEGLTRIRHTDKRHWHHRPVFRQAWILYHVYHDVERAKAEMLSLFQIKSNLKTLVSSVWKPEFERSGKHFIYVGEYTKFLIILAKETHDVETLNSLARKIRRATGLLLDLKEVWELLYESYLTVLGELVGPPPALAVAEVIPRTEFREKAGVYESKMFEQGSVKLPGLGVLQRLCELKKLNEKMAPEGEMGQLLAVCYSKLFIEVGGAELYPKELVRQLSSTMDETSVSVGQDPMDHGQEEDTIMTKSVATTPLLSTEIQVETDAVASSEDVVPLQASAPEDVAMSTKRSQFGDGQEEEEGQQENAARLKMVRLMTEVPVTSNPSSTMDINGALPSIVVEDQNVKEGGWDHSSGTTQATTALPSHSIETPSSPSLSIHAKDISDPGSRMDVEPDMEDWKSRKKISAVELASRATTMCKAPPPSLKAPQSLQSKLAGGPDSVPVQEEVSMTTTVVSAAVTGASEVKVDADAGAENDESEDVVMTDISTERKAGLKAEKAEGDESGQDQDHGGLISAGRSDEQEGAAAIAEALQRKKDSAGAVSDENKGDDVELALPL
ncbi:Histone transcription regulator 3 [Mortierella claussenii]|nr:Histone transcription regulator 3 [Mortierella claussenii]